MLTWILIIIIGGILGWLASIVMRTDAQQGILLNIVVGIIGAVLGGLFWHRCSVAETLRRATSRSAAC
jgi:uncharacterized membrane protein YeaQ/YmgE (transglycosylase-associated protein family)